MSAYCHSDTCTFKLVYLVFSSLIMPLCVCLNKPDRLSPPLDIQLETVNCTAFSVRWKMPRRHVSTITGYKVITDCDFTLKYNNKNVLFSFECDGSICNEKIFEIKSC